MPRYVVTFEVEGRCSFPLDMLRYDCCWPHGSDDAVTIHSSIHTPFCVPGEPSRKVKLITVGSNKTDAVQRVTAARWASFGWIARVLMCEKVG